MSFDILKWYTTYKDFYLLSLKIANVCYHVEMFRLVPKFLTFCSLVTECGNIKINIL